MENRKPYTEEDIVRMGKEKATYREIRKKYIIGDKQINMIFARNGICRGAGHNRRILKKEQIMDIVARKQAGESIEEIQVDYPLSINHLYETIRNHLRGKKSRKTIKSKKETYSCKCPMCGHSYEHQDEQGTFTGRQPWRRNCTNKYQCTQRRVAQKVISCSMAGSIAMY